MFTHPVAYLTGPFAKTGDHSVSQIYVIAPAVAMTLYAALLATVFAG